MKVLIPDGEIGHSIWVCEGLRLKKVELHVMSQSLNPGLKYFINKKSFCFIETEKNETVYVEKIIDYAEKVKADIIVPIGEPSIKAFSKNIKALNGSFVTIPIPNPKIFEIATNKKKLADFCKSHNIPVPKTWSLKSLQKFDYKMDLKFPLIVKPERGDGGKNIHIFFSAYEMIKFASAKKDFSMGEYLVQEYVKGYDIDMSVLAKDGHILAFTIQRGFIKRNNEFAAPAGIMFLYDNKLFRTVEKLIRKLNFTGISHIDLRFDEKTKEYKIVEMNVRFWGSLMGSINAGVNFPYLACLTGLGHNFPIPQYRNIKYIDFISILKKPHIFFHEKITFKETNLPQLCFNPISHTINIIQRRN